jgi:hypothetical protein
MLTEIINQIRSKMQTKARPNTTLIDTRKLAPAKRAKIKSDGSTPVTKGRKPRSKTKKK